MINLALTNVNWILLFNLIIFLISTDQLIFFSRGVHV